MIYCFLKNSIKMAILKGHFIENESFLRVFPPPFPFPKYTNCISLFL